jgi:7-cyano-7-deazaguanine synthase
MSDKPIAICLVSGGMDSCVTAAIAALRYDLAFLHVTYGQRTAKRERKAFDEMADFYQANRRLVAEIDYLTKIGGSSLTDQNIAVTEADLQSTSIPTSYVPFRNTHLIAIAVSWAEVIGAVKIYIGAVSEDSSGYPDCRPEYYQAYNRLIDVGTKPETSIQIVTPVIHLRKSQIVQKGLELGAPLNLSYSCYQDNEIACGHCDSCVLRRRAFIEAGLNDDVIEYRTPVSEFRHQLGLNDVLNKD